jgi:hypothetical protein
MFYFPMSIFALEMRFIHASIVILIQFSAVKDKIFATLKFKIEKHIKINLFS